MSVKTLSVDAIEVDLNVQNRKRLDEYTVESYAGEIANAHPEWPFPPLDVFQSDGFPPVCSSGFHRLEAAKQAKRGSVPCTVHEGSREDAKIFGMTANDRNGLRMTREEKRDCVEWLLDNRKKMTQKDVAKLAGVCVRTVKYIVAERRGPVVDTSKVQISPNPPKVGEPDEDVDEENIDEEEDVITRRRSKPKPKTTLSRSDYYRQYDQAIGPLRRLIDSIADGVGELHSSGHKKTKGHLQKVTDSMMEWMGVER